MKLLPVFGIGLLRILHSTLNKQTSTHMNSTKMYLRFGLYFEALASIFSLAYLFLAGFDGLNAPTLICSAIVGACFLFELLSALKAMQLAPLALCSLCAFGGGIILPTIMGIFFFDEPMSFFQWVGVALFFVSAYFLMPKAEKKISLTLTGIVLLTVNFLINGICSTLGKYFAVRVENGNAALFSCLSYASAAILFCFALIILAIKNKSKEEKSATKEKLPLPKELLLFGIGLGAVCATIVYFSTTLARTIEIVVLNTLPIAICLVGNLILGVMLFKEELTLRKIFGVAFSIASTVIIVLF